MEHKERLKFLKDMTELGLKHTATPEGVQHLDGGGIVNAQNVATANVDPLGTAARSGALGPGGGWSGGSGGIIGGVNDFLGITDNFQAGSADIHAGTNQDQLNTAYNGSQSGLTQQQGIADTVTPGVAQGANTQGILADQLAKQAAGQGPNPAQAALNQSTGQNIEQTAALMASQRGAGANAGATGERAARMGASTQQQAVGQASTLGAQQQLAAQQQQQQLAATQVNQGVGAVQGVNQTQQNEQQILQNSNTASNNASVNMQSNINNANAQTAIANQNAAQNTLGGILSGASAIGSLFAKGGLVKMDKSGKVTDAKALKDLSPEHYALPGKRYPIHDIAHAKNALARISQSGTPAEKAKVKAAVQKRYPQANAQKLAAGGAVTQPVQAGCVKDGYMKMMADGGFISPTPLAVTQSAGPQSSVGQWLNTTATGTQGPELQVMALQPGEAKPLKVPDQKKKDVTKGSPGELPGEDSDTFAQPDMAGGAMDAVIPEATMLAARGGGVQANSSKEKAQVSGDSLKNDKIPAMLSEGEVVMDRATLQDKGPVGQMARAVAAHIAKRNKR